MPVVVLFQHQRAHKNKVALENSFYDVVSSTKSADQAMQLLKSRIIQPGFYYEHIQRWRQYYSDSQVRLVLPLLVL